MKKEAFTYTIPHRRYNSTAITTPVMVEGGGGGGKDERTNEWIDV